MKQRAVVFFLVVGLLFVICPGVHAGLSYRLEDVLQKNIVGGMGFDKINGQDYAHVSLSPDFDFRPLLIGVDLNMYAALGAARGYDSELQPITLRKVAYEDDSGGYGLKWGRLTNITFGYGLLMDQFDSGSGGTMAFTTKKAGVLGYVNWEPVKVEGLMTGRNVKAVRAAYTQYDSFVFGQPMVIGATYASDSDGVYDDVYGRSLRAKQDAYGVDVGLPIGGDFFTVYTEYTKLVDQGQGMNTGVRGDFFGSYDYRFEYRRLGTDFVPGYFNDSYEATAFSFLTDAPHTAINGFLGSLGATFLDGQMKAGAMYEKYDDRDGLFTAATGWKEFFNTSGVINYTVPFNGSNFRMLTSDVIFNTHGFLNYLLQYKRIYITDNSVMESWSFGTRLDLEPVLSDLGFLF